MANKQPEAVDKSVDAGIKGYLGPLAAGFGALSGRRRGKSEHGQGLFRADAGAVLRAGLYDGGCRQYQEKHRRKAGEAEPGAVLGRLA